MKKERKDKHFIKKPIYKGGPTALKHFIAQHLQYPKEALTAKIEGTVVVRYTINHKGKVIDTKIITGIGHGCEEEADRLVRLLTFEVPRNRGVKAVFHKNLQIHFRLPKAKTKATNAMSIQYQYSSSEKKKASTPPPSKKEGYTITINW